MPHLRTPHPDLYESFTAAMAEFTAEHRGTADDDTAIGSDLRTGTWTTPDGFGTYIAALLADAHPATVRAGWVPCTTWWWCDGDTWLGRIALRHTLNDSLRERGGHIGYDVRPTARRRGHATAMLGAVLPHAAARGINPRPAHLRPRQPRLTSRHGTPRRCPSPRRRHHEVLRGPHLLRDPLRTSRHQVRQ